MQASVFLWGIVVAATFFAIRLLFLSREPNQPRTIPTSPVSGSPSRKEEYALLQVSLQQAPPRAALEAASRAVPSICEADCARMSREAFGIVVSNLSEDVSVKFQQALKGQGIPTLRIRLDQLFHLPQGRITRDLRWEGGDLLETDSFGRTLRLQPGNCAFLAAGRIQDRIRKEESRTVKERTLRGGMGRSVPHVDTKITVVKKDVWEPATLYRIDLILLKEPYRLIWLCDPTRPARLNDQVVRVEDTVALRDFMITLSQWLPRERINRGLMEGETFGSFVYPSLSAFEEETVWTLTRRDPTP